MKNELLKLTNFDNDRLLLAVRKAKEKLGTLNYKDEQRDSTESKKTSTPSTNVPQQLEMVEKRLRDADRKIMQNPTKDAMPKKNDTSTPTLSKINNLEHMCSEKIPDVTPGNKGNSYLSSNWDGDYSSAEKKRGYLDAQETGDEWRSSNPLRAGGVLANNGNKTRSSTDAPPSLWSRLKSNQAKEHLYDYLRGIGVDTNNLSDDLKFIIDKGVKVLTGMANEGTLSDYMENKVVVEVANKVATTTVPPMGGSYVVTMVPKSSGNKSLPQPGYVQTPGISDEVIKAVRGYGIDQLVKYQILRAEIAYNEAIRKSGNPVSFLPYYEKLNQEIYEKIAKPVTYTKTNDAGKSVTVTGRIKDLISPNDNSFGAQFAREVIRLTGLDRLDRAGKLVPGENGNYEIDCSRLVCWGLSQMNPKWKVDTISTAARYQIDDFPVVWPTKKKDELDFGKLKPGDTLFWQGVESGDIVHTAIYLGNKMMIETMNTVRIVEVRTYTHGGDQEDSELVQINRMTPEGLDANYEENTH